MTKYSDFVRQWASDHNLSYGCAVSMPQLKSDYLKFKAGEPYGEIDFEPKPKIRKQPKEFEITPAPKKKKVEQEFEITPAKKKKIEKEFIEIIPAAKLKSVPKTTKENMKKIKDAMVLLVEKYTQKLKDLEANKSDANFKKQKQDLLQKLDNVIEKILNKQETSSEELSDMLESFIDQLTLIYKKIDGVKEPIKKKVEAKAKGESKEDIKNKILKEIITLQEKIPEIDIKLKTLDKYAAMITPPREQAIKIMQLQAEKSKINGMIGDLRGKIFNMYGTYNVS